MCYVSRVVCPLNGAYVDPYTLRLLLKTSSNFGVFRFFSAFRVLILPDLQQYLSEV